LKKQQISDRERVEMVMNKLWLKITGIVVLSLAAIIVVNAFWPAETAPTDELRDAWKTQEKDRANLKARPKPHDPEAEKLYQTALLHTPGNSPRPSYQIMMDYCKQIFTQYPNTAQAEKARELLRQYDMTDRQISRLYSSGPAVNKSRPLRRRPPRRYDEWHIATNDEMNQSN
jgi:hypothetical protein